MWFCQDIGNRSVVTTGTRETVGRVGLAVEAVGVIRALPVWSSPLLVVLEVSAEGRHIDVFATDYGVSKGWGVQAGLCPLPHAEGWDSAFDATPISAAPHARHHQRRFQPIKCAAILIMARQPV